MKNKYIFYGILIVVSIITIGILSQQFSLLGYDDYNYYDKELQQGVFSYEFKDKCVDYHWWDGNKYICNRVESKTDKWLFVIGNYGGQVGVTINPESSTEEKILSGKLRLTGNCVESLKAYPLKIEKGYSIKIKVHYEHSSYQNNCCGGSSISLNNVNIYSGSTGSGQGGCFASSKGDADINIYYSILEDKVEVVTTGREPILIDMSKTDKMSFVFDSYGGGYVDIDLKYKIPYDCKIDSNSVLVFDDFSTSFTQNDLSYQPLRYCLDNAPIVRSFEAGGLMQDERGEIFQKLSTNQIVTVQDGQIIRVPYITKYVEGQTLRCGLDEGYNPQTKQCGKLIEPEQPKEVILQCNDNSDCWLPSNCKDISVTCENSVCKYAQDTCNGIEIEKVVTNEVLVYQEVLKTIETENVVTINEAQNEFTYTFDNYNKEFKIGDYTITTDMPTYTCKDDDRDLQSKIYDNNCYEFMIDNKLTKYGETININPYLTATCYAGKRVNAQETFTDNKWISVCKFKINDFIDISPAENNKWFILNSDANYKFLTSNKLYTFNNAGAYLSCYRETGVQQDLPVEENIFILNKDTTENSIKLLTNELGKYNCEIIPFVKINADTQFLYKDNSKLRFSYLVDIKEPQDLTTLNITCNWWCKIKNFFRNLF